MIDWRCMKYGPGLSCTHLECKPSEEEWRAQVAAEHRERQRKEIVRCEHCGTEGIYTYGGVIGPWSKDDGKELTELTDTLRWDGTREFGSQHDLPRCFEKVKRARDVAVEALEMLERDAWNDEQVLDIVGAALTKIRRGTP